MTKLIVCGVLLFGVIYALRRTLSGAFDYFGYGAGMAICATFTVVVIALAFAWDRYERSRSPRSPR